mmetsp:Transcript_24211/g.37287  ORF Transcript_24211/g.37287 Transcript_24211/m.37287 type:complete len:104 (+) Transcript_24211:1389-1700(+)
MQEEPAGVASPEGKREKGPKANAVLPLGDISSYHLNAMSSSDLQSFANLPPAMEKFLSNKDEVLLSKMKIGSCDFCDAGLSEVYRCRCCKETKCTQCILGAHY